MPNHLTKASLIAGTLVITLGLTGCHFEFSLGDNSSDYIESTEEAAEAAAETAEEAAEAAAEAAENAAEVAEETADAMAEAADDSWFDSEAVDALMTSLIASSDSINQAFEEEAAKYYDDEKAIAKSGKQLISMHNPLSTDVNKFHDKARLSGGFTAWKFEAAKDKTVEVPYEFYVAQGMTKLVFVTPDGKVQTLIEKQGSTKNNTTKGTFKLNLKKGDNFIRIVGKDQAMYGVNLAPPEGEFDYENEGDSN